MTAPRSRLVCSGCGAAPPPSEPYPFRCPNAGTGDIDHVLARILDLGASGWPDRDPAAGQPFVRYRRFLHSYHRARAAGLSDEAYVELVTGLDLAVFDVAGIGFAATPYGRSEFLSNRLGFAQRAGVWVKDETGNVAGSHKGRHLMGVLLHLELVDALGLRGADSRPDLAVASCGNAALAAAILAKATARRLNVFVPVGADPWILDRLGSLGAEVVVCAREAGQLGDPAYHAFRGASAAGAVPFSCQGNENGLVIEGGETLGYEIVSDLIAAGSELDHLVVQVGGGALASACVQAFAEAAALGAIGRLPKIHVVQTASAHPLERAFRLLSDAVSSGSSDSEIDDAVRFAATHRSAYMWAWETEPGSIATGILDDETYDWRVVVSAMLHTGGQPVVVTEAQLAAAHALGLGAGIAVDPTGTAGLAGVVALRDEKVIGPGDRVAVLFTGAQR